MKAATAALAMCCLVHAGIAGALLGWSIGSWTGAVVVAAFVLVLVSFVRRRTRRRVTDDGRVAAGTEPTR